MIKIDEGYKKVLHITNKNAINGGVGNVIKYLNKGLKEYDEFESHSLLTDYNHQEMKPEKSELIKDIDGNKKVEVEGGLEKIIDDYDLVHVHGVPHYGVLENLEKVKNKKNTKIVNTVHSSVKKEFLTHYNNAKNSDEEQLKNDFKCLKYYLDNGILEDPTKFGETFWGSSIYRQEKIMTISDSIQHMNDVYKNEIINEYKANENKNKHKVIPNGVEKIEEYTERPKDKRILYVGRFAKEKGIDELIESLPQVFEEHPDAKIKLVGGDKEGNLVKEYRNKVEKRIKDYFSDKEKHNHKDYLSNIEFTGWISDKEKLKEHYRWTDYVIIPSTAESFSLTASEALMHKRIPIMTKTKALDDLYISKGIGIGINEEDRHPEGIANVLKDVLKNHKSKDHDKIAEKGRKFVLENYSFENMIKNQVKSYKELLEKRKEKDKKEK